MERASRSRLGVIVSVGVHAAALSVLLIGGARMRVRTVPPAKPGFLAMLEVAGGSHRVSIPSFEAPNTSQAQKAEHVKEPEHKVMDPIKAAHKEKETPSALPQDSAVR